ncbi:MAG TPA: ABC transporter ATP-binding protein [Polyangiales bacterium]|nr:ABC transporter ATP-binding protein [Polyangiales bacterium]
MVELRVHALEVTIRERRILHGVSFQARAGELLAVLGPNGAGKSTLLRALLGLVPHGGEVRIGGVLRAQLPAHELAKKASLVPAQSQLTAALRVREVVALGRYSHRATQAVNDARIERALVETDLVAFADRAYSELSTGEQKRTLLARALCTDASLLLLDEPTASLDIEHALRLFVLLRALAADGRTVVLVMHQLEHALAFADHALLLQRGKPLAFGPARDVITPANVRALYGVDMIERDAPGFRLP